MAQTHIGRLIGQLTGRFRSDDLSPVDTDAYESRLGRYRIAHALVQGTLDNDSYAWLTKMREQQGLYKFIRSLRAPTRLVDYYGELVWQDMDQHIIQARRGALRVWGNSDWLTHDEMAVRNGATYGDLFIGIADDPQGTRLETISPFEIRDMGCTPTGEITSYSLEREVEVGVVYGETCEQTAPNSSLYVTYKNGQEHHYPGNPGSRWYVDYAPPLVHAKFLPSNDKWGASALDGMTTELLAINGLLSLMVDRVRRSDPILVVQGPSGMVDSLSFSEAETRDDIRVLACLRPLSADHNAGAQVDYEVPTLNMSGIIELLDYMTEGLENNHPVLALLKTYRINKGDVPSGRALYYLQEPVKRSIKSIRQRLDRALERATNKALEIENIRGRGNYAQQVQFDSDRPVFSADKDWEADLTQKILRNAAQMQAVGIDPANYLQEAGIIKEDIESLTPPTEAGNKYGKEV